MINMKLKRITELRAKLEQDLLAVICAFEKETEMIPISIDFDFVNGCLFFFAISFLIY